MRLMPYLLIIAAFLGPYAYLGWEKLHLIRILAPLLVFVLIIQKVKVSQLAGFLIGFYTIYVLYTIVISCFHLDYINPNDIFNLTILLFFVISVILLIQYDRDLFRTALVRLCWLFVLVSIPIFCFEVITHQHLPLSGMANPNRPDYSYYHLPTVFYTNANDFAFIYTLVVMFLLSREKRAWVVSVIVAGSLIVVYITESRLAFLGLLSFLLFYFRLSLFKAVVTLSAAAVLLVLLVAFTDEFSPDRILNFDYSPGSSISRRLQLTKGGLESATYNYGMGFGVGSSHYYYSRFFSPHEPVIETDPHNFFLEVLINSGVVMALSYILISAFLFASMITQKANRLIVAQFVIYHLLLLSSSSSLFLWSHYVFFFTYVFFAKDKGEAGTA
ncbi:MAG TPA: O-antigen ligase family protein [Cyclobacteriaceae bacterium]|jgi:hypothetical protein